MRVALPLVTSLSVVTLAALAACSSSDDGAGSAAAAAGASGAAGSSSAGAGGSSSAGSAGDAKGSIVKEGDVTTITMDTFVVEPGEEVYRCQNFVNPFEGDVDVGKFESHMTPGSHHLLVFYQKVAETGEATPCSGLEFHASPYSTQLPEDSVEYPSGVGARVKKADGFRLQSHYLNTTKSPINAVVQVKLHTLPGGATQQAGVLFMVQPSFKVEPKTQQTVTRKCKMPLDASIVLASSHMHKHGTHFVASIAGQTVHEVNTWADPPPSRFNPPLAFKKGDPIEFACTFQNDGSVPLTFGESAESNEMCIANMQFFPVPDGSPVTMDCQ